MTDLECALADIAEVRERLAMDRSDSGHSGRYSEKMITQMIPATLF